MLTLMDGERNEGHCTGAGHKSSVTLCTEPESAPTERADASYYRARYYDASTGRFLAEDPLKFRAGVNFYPYAHNRPEDLNDPFGLWTIQIGINVGYTLPFGITGSGFAGFAIDGNGSVGTYWGWGVGADAGAGASGGVSVQHSDARSICDLGGPFINASGGGGAAAAGTLDVWGGMSPDGFVTGEGATIGVGAGASAGASRTVTYVHPFGHGCSSCH
jgi:RHS repeat-associated protein